MDDDFDSVRAAAIDGRMRSVFYRQQQIERLCRTLLENAENIRKAIISDYGHTESEATVEFSLTLSAIRNTYAALQPKKAHEDEYAVANGKDAPENREPAGIVYIEPTTHTLFYSTVVPLSAALAAGNCVIVLVWCSFYYCRRMPFPS
jgi:acyl-CoA reductase-like NAD-dependent aldehyde dehydrogenase